MSAMQNYSRHGWPDPVRDGFFLDSVNEARLYVKLRYRIEALRAGHRYWHKRHGCLVSASQIASASHVVLLTLDAGLHLGRRYCVSSVVVARVGDAPIRIFHGAADDATVIVRCREYVARLRNAGKDVALFEYAGAKHWFDNADLANRQTATGVANFSNCTFVERDDRIVDAPTGELAGPSSPCVVSEGTFGYHPEARQQAAADVRNFLRLLFQLQ
jgi:acetyl esterase/lipase